MKTKLFLLAGFLILAIQTPVLLADDTNSAASLAGPEASGFTGKVVETTNAAGYTYVRVDTGGKKLWAVTTQFPVAVGDTVTVGAGMPMDNYHSKSLNRDFDRVYFTGSINVNGGAAGAAPALPPGHPAIPAGGMAGLPAGHPSLTAPAGDAAIDLKGIKKAEGGKTIQEIYAARKKLAGKEVTVRGKVVKYNAMILGKNWLHIQDGSGSAEKGDNDLTVTSADSTSLGATVLVSGIVHTNRDFGAGYKYEVIIEDAKLTPEPGQ
jgi:hypothetical protein